MNKKRGADCSIYRLLIDVASGRELLNTLASGSIASGLKLCLHQKFQLILVKAKELLDSVKGDFIRQSHFNYFVFVFQFHVPVFRRHSRWFHPRFSAPAGICR